MAGYRDVKSVKFDESSLEAILEITRFTKKGRIFKECSDKFFKVMSGRHPIGLAVNIRIADWEQAEKIVRELIGPARRSKASHIAQMQFKKQKGKRALERFWRNQYLLWSGR